MFKMDVKNIGYHVYNLAQFSKTNQPIYLLNYIKDKSRQSHQFEVKVTVGAEARLQARLIACKLSQEAASRRRAKLNKNSRRQKT